MIGVGLFSYQFGGSERVGVDLALAFKARGFEPLCFAFHDSAGPMRAELEQAGVPCVDLNYERTTGWLRYPRYLWRTWRVLRAARVRALHLHHHGALILCGPPARCAGIRRVVMTEHGLQALQERPWARRLTRLFRRFASDITVVEPAQAEYFVRALRVPAARVHCIANAVRLGSQSPERRAALRASLGIADGTFAFFYVGRLNAVKNLGSLLGAFARLPQQEPPNCRLFLVGDGPERAALEQRVVSLGLSRSTTLLGARADVAALLSAADGFVMSSRSEGLPVVLLEAMATGVPCIATAVGGIPGLLGGERGITVPVDDEAALANAMRELASSPTLRASLTSKAREELERNYAFEPIVDRYLALLGLPPRAP